MSARIDEAREGDRFVAVPNASVPLEITCRAVRDMRDAGNSFLILDCREPDEYAVARIEGAVLLPMSEIGPRLGELSRHREGPIVVHCHHGGRSLQVAAWLRQQGYEQAQSMAGGIDQWAIEIDSTVPRY